jgi:hypothetical protein
VFDGGGERLFLDEDEYDGGDHRQRDHPDEDGRKEVVAGADVRFVDLRRQVVDQWRGAGVTCRVCRRRWRRGQAFGEEICQQAREQASHHCGTEGGTDLAEELLDAVAVRTSGLVRGPITADFPTVGTQARGWTAIQGLWPPAPNPAMDIHFPKNNHHSPDTIWQLRVRSQPDVDAFSGPVC